MKKEKHGVVVGIVSVLYIIGMWVKKDLVSTQVTITLPLVVTSVAVTIFKVSAIALVVLFIKWLTSQLKRKKLSK